VFDHAASVIPARAQFVFTVSFEFIFLGFSIGMATHRTVPKGLWLSTERALYRWVREPEFFIFGSRNVSTVTRRPG
jgi:cytochrome bd-type quinol oxidase subunit 1